MIKENDTKPGGPSVDFTQTKAPGLHPSDGIIEKSDRLASKKMNKPEQVTVAGAGFVGQDEYGQDGDEKMVNDGGAVFLYKKAFGKWYKTLMTPVT